jgi:dTDP-4-dehydrorhamnose 3,5-epimerase
MPIEFEALPVSGVWRARPSVFTDSRGAFAEWFRPDQLLAATGQPFPVAQANQSSSRRGVLRGIHFADVPPGQAKWIRATAGEVLDVVVDLRIGSPTFAQHCAIRLTADDPTAVVIAEGLGHAFCALTDEATVNYLLSSSYNPAAEHAIDPFDLTLGIPWPLARDQLILSERDAAAPSIAEAARAGLLPTWEACQALPGRAAPTDRAGPR